MRIYITYMRISYILRMFIEKRSKSVQSQSEILLYLLLPDSALCVSNETLKQNGLCNMFTQQLNMH